jgi:hypothetical protein
MVHASHEDDRGVIASEGRVTTRNPRDESVPLQRCWRLANHHPETTRER